MLYRDFLGTTLYFKKECFECGEAKYSVGLFPLALLPVHKFLFF